MRITRRDDPDDGDRRRCPHATFRRAHANGSVNGSEGLRFATRWIRRAWRWPSRRRRRDAGRARRERGRAHLLKPLPAVRTPPFRDEPAALVGTPREAPTVLRTDQSVVRLGFRRERATVDAGVPLSIVAGVHPKWPLPSVMSTYTDESLLDLCASSDGKAHERGSRYRT